MSSLACNFSKRASDQWIVDIGSLTLSSTHDEIFLGSNCNQLQSLLIVKTPQTSIYWSSFLHLFLNERSYFHKPFSDLSGKLAEESANFESWQKLNFMIRLSAAETETRKIANIGKQCSDNNDLNQCSGGSAENWSVAKV